MRIGIICPSEIAFRRFLPALKEAGCFEYAGVAIASKEEFVGATRYLPRKEPRLRLLWILMEVRYTRATKH